MTLRNAIDWPIVWRNLATVAATVLGMLGCLALAAGWLL